MRIIAGQLGGQPFDAPTGHRTHPMSDKIRGALFNALGDVKGLEFLDAFAGSGAVGFEAVSRGASSVVAIDNDRTAQQCIARNIRQLNVSQKMTLVKASAAAWLSTTSNSFDVVVCDPPYDAIKPELIQRVAERTKPGGIVVLSLPPGADVVLDSANYVPLKAKNYGDAELQFYRRHN